MRIPLEYEQILIRNKIKKVLSVIIMVILVIVAIETVFPLVFLLINSFKPQSAIYNHPFGLNGFSFKYLSQAISEMHLLQGVRNSLVLTVLSVALIILVSSLTAWIMYRCRSKASDILYYIFAAAMLIPFQSIIYPLVSFMDTLGLKTYWGLILMYGGSGLSMSILLYYGFLRSISESIEEAAIIDGANILQMFFQVVFPMLRPITITIAIFNVVWIWNDYLLPYYVIGTKENQRTVTLQLYYAKLSSGMDLSILFPAVMISIIPIIVIFFILQKYIIRDESEAADEVRA
jgi:raffinose/stachyose/melibiose transport system permease protein